MLWRLLGNKLKKNLVSKKFKDYKKLIGLPFFTILRKLNINKDHKKIHSVFNEISIKMKIRRSCIQV